MDTVAQKKLALFFTRGMSLQKWQAGGMLAREIKPYVELAKRFHTIYFFTYGTHDLMCVSLLPNNIIIVQRPRYIPSNIYSIVLPLIQAKILRTVDFVKTNQMDGSWAAVIAKKLFGCTLIVRCGYEWLDLIIRSHRPWYKRLFAYLVEWFAYRNADCISITSVAGREFISNTFSIPSDRIRVIPNYIDTHTFLPLPITKIPNRIVFVGRMEPEKNLYSLIDGMIGLGVHLVIIGRGGQREALEIHARKQHVNIQFLGTVAQDALPVELNKSSVFILPSLHEGNPKALLEAMSCGLPCIGTDVVGIQTVISNKKTGILCSTDASSIHAALVWVLDNAELCNRIGRAARNVVVETYSLEVVLKQELKLYEN